MSKWHDEICAAVTQSTARVLMTGPRWASTPKLRGIRDDKDVLRQELVTALASAELTVVPVLVSGANFLKALELPAVLQSMFEVWSVRYVTEKAGGRHAPLD